MDREKVIKGVHDARRYLEDREWVDKSVGVHIDALNDALALLKEQEAEYENGFNDAMLGKQELMYEGIDGKWHKKDW